MWMPYWGCVLIWIIYEVSPVKGVAKTTAICGDGATDGKPYVLTCNIENTIVHGVRWFREGVTDRVITCTSIRECVSNDPKYEVDSSAPHPLDKQNFTIISVALDDIGKTWTCVDGITLPNPIPPVSTCTLTVSTTADTTSTTASTSTTGGSLSSVINTGTSDSETTTFGSSSRGSDGGGLSDGEKAGIGCGVVGGVCVVGGVVGGIVYKKKNRK